MKQKNHIFTPDNISVLEPNEVFVFGSNLAGRHAGGAARAALNKFGAIDGQGVGLQGQSYAIPTMQGGVDTIKPYVDKFIIFAKSHPDKFFYVTRIGCGIAGFEDEEIAQLFEEALNLNNVCLPESFVQVFNRQNAKQIELTKKILHGINIHEIIFASIACAGAQGSPGEIGFYVIEKCQLIHYRTNLFENEDLFAQVNDLLLSRQDDFRSSDIDPNEILFNYYYVGGGNCVLVNKNVTLHKADGYYIYKVNNFKYKIHSYYIPELDETEDTHPKQ